MPIAAGRSGVGTEYGGVERRADKTARYIVRRPGKIQTVHRRQSAARCCMRTSRPTAACGPITDVKLKLA